MIFFSKWMLSIIATAILISVAQALMLQEHVRRVGKFVSSLLLLAAIVGPALRLSPSELPQLPQNYSETVAMREEYYRGQQESQLGEIIKEESEAYIEAKGQSLGEAVRAEVEVTPGPDGYPVPESVTLYGTYQPALETLIWEDLGVDIHHQTWKEEGA